MKATKCYKQFATFEDNNQNLLIIYTSGLVAQWITRLPTEQKIAGSSPAEVENPFFSKQNHQRLKL